MTTELTAKLAKTKAQVALLQAAAELALKDPAAAAELLLETACEVQKVVATLEDDLQHAAAVASTQAFMQAQWDAMTDEEAEATWNAWSA